MAVVIRRNGRFAALTALAVLSAIASGFGTSTAQAALSYVPGANSSVYAISEPDSSGTRYVGGNFSAFNQWDTGGGAIVDATTAVVQSGGAKLTSQSGVSTTNGKIYDSAPDGAGGFYVVGDFRISDGTNTRYNVARVNGDGTINATFNPPQGSSQYLGAAAVKAVAVAGGKVYLGYSGSFTYSSVAYQGIAAADATTGALDTAWHPSPSGTGYVINDVEVSGSTVYAGGTFTNFGGQSRSNVAATAVADGSATGTATSWAPDTNGAVNAVEASGPTVYLGGAFTTVGGSAHNYAAAVDAASGVATTWNPNPSGQVKDIEVDGSGGIYLAGLFTTISSTVRYGVARVDAAGALDTGFNANLGVAGSVQVDSVAIDGTSAYLVGKFTTAGGFNRGGSAKVSAATGSLDQSWDAVLGGAGASVPGHTVTVSGTGALFVGGEFTKAGGTRRNGAAAIKADGTLSSWNPGVRGWTSGQPGVSAVAVSGSTVYIAGTFNSVGGVARNYAAALSTGDTATLQPWNPNPSNAVNAIAVSGSTVYLGGGFTGVGGVSRNYAAAVGTDGILSSWNPNPSSAVNAIAVSGSTVYLGGSFSSVGGVTRNYAAAVSTGNTATLQGWNPTVLGVEVKAVVVSGSTVYLGGTFTKVNGTDRSGAAAVGTDGTLSAWNPNLGGGSAYAISLSGGNVYIGGVFTTVGGVSRSRLGAVSDGSTATLQSWNPNSDAQVNAIAVSGPNAFIGGGFGTLNGAVRIGLGAVSSAGAGSNFAAWPSNVAAWSLLTVSRAGSGTGTVTSPVAAPGIDCGSACQESYADGTSVTLTASAAAGSTFTGWSGEGCSGTGTCTVTMSQARNVTATFAATYALSVSKSGSGSGSVSSSPSGVDCGSTCSYSFSDGTSVTLTATPASGSTFTSSASSCAGGSWTAGAGGTYTCTVTMSQARSATAVFNADETLTVSRAGAGTGSVSSSPSGISCGSTCAFAFAYGSSVTLTATPTGGSAFTGWSGDCSGTGTCTVTADQARSVVATFQPSETLTVSRGGTGSGSVTSSPSGIDCGSTCSFDFAYNAAVTLTALPAAGSTFTGWSGGGCSGTGTCSVTMNQVESVTATFDAAPSPGPGPTPDPGPSPGPTPPGPTPTPSNSFVTNLVGVTPAVLSSRVVVPGPGTVVQRGTFRRGVGAGSARTRSVAACRTTRTIIGAGRYTVRCRLSRAARDARKKRSIRVTLRTTFTPAGGTARTKIRVVRLKKTGPSYAG